MPWISASRVRSPTRYNPSTPSGTILIRCGPTFPGCVSRHSAPGSLLLQHGAAASTSGFVPGLEHEGSVSHHKGHSSNCRLGCMDRERAIGCVGRETRHVILNAIDEINAHPCAVDTSVSQRLSNDHSRCVDWNSQCSSSGFVIRSHIQWQCNIGGCCSWSRPCPSAADGMYGC